jgi:hypothetical protein
MTVEYFIQKYGENYRKLITDALMWLDEREPTWKLDTPIDRGEYIQELIAHSYDK